MTEISLDLVKKLREETAVSIMQCKKALEEADGDYEKAKIALTKKAGEIAAKKSDRELASGSVAVVKSDNRAIIIELACETDFVSGNDDFKKMALEVAEKILNNSSEEEVKEILSTGVQKFGERIEVVKKEIMEGNIGSYVHSNNSVGALVSFENEVDEELGRDIAMHVAAQNPKYLSTDDISEEERQKTEDTLREEVMDKPEEMRERILEGKMKAFFKERVLLTQSFIKNPDMTVEDYLNSKDNKVLNFVRIGVGE